MTVTPVEDNPNLVVLTADTGKLLTQRDGGLRVTETTIGADFVEDWIEIDEDTPLGEAIPPVS